jgi:3-keto-L-gulonate-6-phosphate decarboxylase
VNRLEDKIEKIDGRLTEINLQLKTQELPNQGIFFDGQIFDAYAFVSDLIKKAKSDIILIDNYIDESTLTHLSKKAKNVKVILLTKHVSKQLMLDLKKANEQYGNYEAKELKLSHDRFLIIDQKEMYHIGASLKDLGKKWFAFSKLDGHLITLILGQLSKEEAIEII